MKKIFTKSLWMIALEIAKEFAKTIVAMMLIWIFVSWVNVAMNNTSPDTIANIWSFNFFKVFF